MECSKHKQQQFLFFCFLFFFHLRCACSGKLVTGVSLLLVSLSRLSGRHVRALYGFKAHINDNENVVYRVNKRFECCKISSKFYSLSFLPFVYLANIVYVTWRHYLNLTASSPPNPFEITSHPNNYYTV